MKKYTSKSHKVDLKLLKYSLGGDYLKNILFKHKLKNILDLKLKFVKNYTSKKQKVAMYSKKYNIEPEEVHRILTEYEDVLTLDELKIKYDNPNIGVLPDWLTEEELDLMIWKTIHTNWNTILEAHTTREDLYIECQEYIRKKIALYRNHQHLKASLVLRLKTVTNEYTRKGKYFIGSLDDVYENDNSTIKHYKYEPSQYLEEQYEFQDIDLLNKIKSIKDINIQNILIITGYLVCNIDGLQKEYLRIKYSSNEEVKKSLLDLENIIKNNDDIKINKLPEKVKKLSVMDVVQALKLDIFKETSSIKSKKKQLLNYLNRLNVKELLA